MSVRVVRLFSFNTCLVYCYASRTLLSYHALVRVTYTLFVPHASYGTRYTDQLESQVFI